MPKAELPNAGFAAPPNAPVAAPNAGEGVDVAPKAGEGIDAAPKALVAAGFAPKAEAPNAPPPPPPPAAEDPNAPVLDPPPNAPVLEPEPKADGLVAPPPNADEPKAEEEAWPKAAGAPKPVFAGAEGAVPPESTFASSKSAGRELPG